MGSLLLAAPLPPLAHVQPAPCRVRVEAKRSPQAVFSPPYFLESAHSAVVDGTELPFPLLILTSAAVSFS